MPPNRLSVLDSSWSTGQRSPSSPSTDSSSAVSQEAKTAAASRYVLPKDLDAAITHLDDQQLDRLVSVALEERARRKRPLVPEESQRKRNAEAVSPSLPKGKLNAVRAAFKAGVTPARIAREFGISRSDVQRALASEAKK
jgi:DNA-directed RNA polymerase specialized sigma subunit